LGRAKPTLLAARFDCSILKTFLRRLYYNRREFLIVSSCFLATPAVALAAQAYEPGLVKQLLSEGKTVFVDYTTEGCTA